MSRRTELKHYQSPSPPQNLWLTRSAVTTPSPAALGYTMGKTLGSGTFAKVKAAWSPFQRRMVAIKIVNKSKMDQDQLDKFLPREISVIQKVSHHPNILSIFRIVETELRCFFALELAENGDLLEYLHSRGGRIPEQEARHVFHQMCDALSYCHSLGIAHRDVKLENILFNKDMDVKIGDFGFAIESRQSNLCSTPCGSYSYAAPEIVLANNGEYDPLLADSWSMGVVLYSMVMGRLPFGVDSRVTNGLFNYNLLHFDFSHTQEFSKLVKSLLTVDVATRPYIADVATHTWMTAFPSTRPTWKGQGGSKYTLENSLPQFLHHSSPGERGTSKFEATSQSSERQSNGATDPVPTYTIKPDVTERTKPKTLIASPPYPSQPKFRLLTPSMIRQSSMQRPKLLTPAMVMGSLPKARLLTPSMVKRSVLTPSMPKSGLPKPELLTPRSMGEPGLLKPKLPTPQPMPNSSLRQPRLLTPGSILKHSLLTPDMLKGSRLPTYQHQAWHDEIRPAETNSTIARPTKINVCDEKCNEIYVY